MLGPASTPSARPTGSERNRSEADEGFARRVSLHPVRPHDYPFLYDLAASGDLGYRWRYYGASPTFDTFVQTFQRSSEPQFVAIRGQADDRVGWVMSYRFDLANGTAYMGVVMAPSYIGTGLGLEVAGQFVDYLFKYWNLRKVYSEAPGFTFGSVASGVNAVLKEEGVLRAHRYYDGRFWDEHIIAIYREDWERLRPHVPWLSDHPARDDSRHPGEWWRDPLTEGVSL